MIIDVDRFASRHSRRNYKRNFSSWSSSSADVDAVDPDSATADADYDDHNDPIIYVTNHSHQSMSTLGTMGFKEIRVKKTVDPSTASEHPTNQHSRVLLDHGAISSEERSAKKPPLPPPPPPPPPLAQPLKRQTSTPLTDQTHRLRSSSSSSSSSAKHPGEVRPAVTHDSQREELSWHDRKAFKHNLKALKQVPPPPSKLPSKLPLTRRASAPIERQQQQQQSSSSTRTKKKLSPIPQKSVCCRGRVYS